jgi:hypothetical protein
MVDAGAKSTAKPTAVQLGAAAFVD